jgi:hypothetical protein
MLQAGRKIVSKGCHIVEEERLTVPMLGTARSGIDSKAPMLTAEDVV